MKLLKILLFAMIKLISLFFLPFPVRKNRIVFSSYFSYKPEGNLKCILDALQKEGACEVHTLFMKYDRFFAAKLHYFLNIFREIYYFSTSKVVVLEGNSVVLSALPKKKGVFALQLWHAAGAFKKFGQDTDRLYRIRGLDGVVVSSKKVAGIYADALNVPREQVYVLGIPRLDPLFTPGTAEKYAASIKEKYPALQGKKVILYAPTFRGKGIDDITAKEVDLLSVAKGIPKNYVLAVRLHPLMRGQGLYGGFTDLSGEDLIETLCAADVLITDYSSVIFEYSALNRPMLFLTPDLCEYTKTRGFYQDYESFVPGKICRSEKELAQAVCREDFETGKLKSFADDYIDFRDNRSTERVVRLINGIMKDIPYKRTSD